MKLLYCPACNDVVRLYTHPRSCECGEAKGMYTDRKHAIFTSGIPFGVHNLEFVQAAQQRPKAGPGARFLAWVFAENHKSLEAVDGERWAERAGEVDEEERLRRVRYRGVQHAGPSEEGAQPDESGDTGQHDAAPQESGRLRGPREGNTPESDHGSIPEEGE